MSDTRGSIRRFSSRSSSGNRPGPARPTRSSTLLIFVVLISSTIIVIGSTSPFQGVRGTLADILRPVRTFGATIGAPIGNIFESVGSHQDLVNENRRLREENAELATKVGVAEDAIRQRRELLEMNDLDDPTALPSVVAEVVRGTTTNFGDATIEISVGSAKGVKEGMPVVAGLGLVGRVTVVTNDSARVRLFTDSSMGVGVRLGNSGEVGIIRGSGAGKEMVIELVEPPIDIEIGEPVFTAGLNNSRYPNGLQLGVISKAERVAGSLQQNVVMEPFTDLERVSLVKVLLWVPPTPVPMTAPTSVPPTSVAPSTTIASGEGG